MPALADTSLSADERALVERFVEELRMRLGSRVHAVRLFGSRARGERASAESDVDVLVLVDDASWAQRREISSFFVAEVDRDKVILGGHG
jgi:predicted nucleotidyltransferase